MTPEEIAREFIDIRLKQSGWVIQNLQDVNPMVSLGVAVREYPTSTGPVDYALFVDGKPVGIVEAKNVSVQNPTEQILIDKHDRKKRKLDRDNYETYNVLNKKADKEVATFLTRRKQVNSYLSTAAYFLPRYKAALLFE